MTAESRSRSVAGGGMPTGSDALFVFDAGGGAPPLLLRRAARVPGKWACLGLLAVLALSGVGCSSDAPGPDGDGNASGGGSAAGGGNAGELIEVPDPLSEDNPRYPLARVSVPAAGEAVTDGAFGTAQRRVVQTVGLRHEYSRHDPFNADGSLVLLLLVAEGQWRVYRTASVPYDQAGNLVRTLSLEEPRWDPVDPRVIWGLEGFRVVTVDVESGQSGLIKDFARDATIGPILAANPDLYRITMKDEGESSADKRYWAFLLQGSNDDYRVRYLFTWDRQEDRVIGLRALSADESSIDWVGMSPSGRWVLIGGDWNNGGDLAGLTMANRELTEFHRLDYATGHADVGVDSAGNEVVVMQNVRTDYIDMIPLDSSTQPILEPGGSYAGTGRVPLIRLFYDSSSPLGLNSGVHISCNVPGYCVVSTHLGAGMPEQNWLDRTIVLVRLDGERPRAWYLAKVHGTTEAYWEETHASMARDGSRLVWATNWGQDVGQERVWLMELEMPGGWMAALASVPGAGP